MPDGYFDRGADVRAKTILNRIVAVLMREERNGRCCCSLCHGVISYGGFYRQVWVLRLTRRLRQLEISTKFATQPYGLVAAQ